MELLKFDMSRCDLCGQCIEKCPFGALRMEKNGIAVGEQCRMCSVCVKTCPHRAIHFEQAARSCDKSKWRDILVYAEQENGALHPVVFELIGEARKLAEKVGYSVSCVIVGGQGTRENAEKLLPYGVKEVFVYQHPGFEGFKADCYSDAVADCISTMKPSCVLIGATAKQCEETLEKVGFHNWQHAGYDFEKAVNMAFEMTGEGGTVLLSPSCASFDMFPDYEARGRIFKEIVNKLESAKA